MNQQSKYNYYRELGIKRINSSSINISDIARVITYKQNFEGIESALQYANKMIEIKANMLSTCVSREQLSTGKLKIQFVASIKLLNEELKKLQFAKSKLEEILEGEKGRKSYEK